jgi:signal transduction histidine kinase
MHRAQRSSLPQIVNPAVADGSREFQPPNARRMHAEKLALLGRLAADLAHEINNPVSFIAASIVPLQRRLGDLAFAEQAESVRLLGEIGDLVRAIAHGAERTAAIVKDLKNFSRTGDAARKPVDLHDGLEMSLRLLKSRWTNRIAIHREYGQLPLVECNPSQVNQVLMNVLANACDAIVGEGNIWITTHAGTSAVQVTIRDDGSGIAPDVLEHIFEPFFTTKDLERGTGLGLAISDGIVKAHSGLIEVESSLEAGATFRVTLPLNQ